MRARVSPMLALISVYLVDQSRAIYLRRAFAPFLSWHESLARHCRTCVSYSDFSMQPTFCRCAAYKLVGSISSFYFSLASTHKKNARAGDTKPLYSLKNAPPCFWGLLVKVAQNAFVLARPLSSHIYMGLIWSGLRLAGVYALILYCSRHAATMNPACLPHRFA